MFSRYSSLMLSCCLAMSQVQAADAPVAPVSPAQAAFLKAENQKAEDAFVRDVAGIVRMQEAAIRKLLPEQGRITDPLARLVAGLERDLKRPLTDEQKAAITEADRKFREAREAARVAARKK